MKAEFILSAHHDGVSGSVGMAELIIDLDTGWLSGQLHVLAALPRETFMIEQGF
jgi:hypothetical protein